MYKGTGTDVKLKGAAALLTWETNRNSQFVSHANKAFTWLPLPLSPAVPSSLSPFFLF